MADFRKLGKGAMGALGKLNEIAKARQAPQAEAMLLAQQRAALPVSKGGLGLPPNNTAEQRAAAMRRNTDAYHGSKQDITGAFQPGYDDNLAFVTKSPEFANKWIGKGKHTQRTGEQAKQEVKSAEDTRREIRSRNMNYDDALERLKGEEFNNEYDRRSALSRAELEKELPDGMPDKIHSTVYPLTVESNKIFNPETDMDVMADFFKANDIPPKLQDLYAGGNYMMYETKPVVEYLKGKGYDSMRLRESTGDDYPTIAVFNPESVRSKFAAHDPWRKTAATAALMGVAAPDLLAKETDEHKAKGGVLHMAKAGKVGAAVEGITGALTKLNEIAKARKAASESKMADVLESKTAPMTTPMGTGLPLMPREQGMYTPREQKDLPRMIGVDKARAEGKSPKYNERMQDLLDSPKARQKVNNLINKGKDLNVQEWYGTEPLRQVAMDAGRSPEQFESLMAQLASASQRNPVDKQNQMGSYLYHLSETGQLPENSLLLTNKLKKALKEDPSLAEGRQLVELPKGYGSLAQGDIFNRAVQIGQGDILGALPPNKKLGTFYENLLGNLKPVTVDVNALRGPIIEQGDPRWLTSKLVEKDETGKVINSYKPREMYDTGEMTMREAQQRPGFWEAAPSGSEYAGFEDLWQRGAKRHGVEPAEAQALGWYGSADVTALKTKPENYVDNLERLIKRTAEQTGKSPTEVMNDMVTGKGFLRKEGGAIAKPSWHLAVEKHMKDGGYTMADPKHIPAVRSLKHLAKGGESKDDSASLKELYEALPDFYDQAIKPEVESYKKPRAFTDLMNRGVIANNPVSAVVDLTNFGLSGIDALTKGTRIPTRFSSEKPFGGSEQIKDLMKEYGMTTDEERPIAETLLGFLSPGSLVGGTIKGANTIKKAGTAMKDMATSKKARGGLTLMR